MQLDAPRAEVEARFRRVGIGFPPTLARLFDAAASTPVLEALWRVGIDLTCNAYDVIGEADGEHADFVGFCTNGGGDVYGFRMGSIVRFWHEDESFEPFAADIDAWLERILAESEDSADDVRTIRSALG